MPLVHSASRGAISENIRRERATGKPQKQAVAIALNTQREAQQHRSRHMPDNSSHAPGHEISGEGGAVRQRHGMGEGKAPMGGNFGVSSMAEGNNAGSHGHGDHMPHDGVMLHDSHRAGPPALDQGAGAMGATAHSHHGPHHHHDVSAGGSTRPHHVGGSHSTGGRK